MMRRFDRQLEDLNTQLIEMGMLIETAIDKCIHALLEKDKVLAKEAIVFDEEINQKERDIERNCFKLLLQQQPVARDLRLISTALKMITDMERIGDHAADISEITIRLSEDEYIKRLEHIPMMADAAVKMVRKSVDAFVNRDLELAHEVIKDDDTVDEMFSIVRDDLIEMIHTDTRYGEQAVDLIMISKYFERIGDHAVNIAEWVEYAMTGIHKGVRIE